MYVCKRVIYVHRHMLQSFLMHIDRSGHALHDHPQSFTSSFKILKALKTEKKIFVSLAQAQSGSKTCLN